MMKTVFAIIVSLIVSSPAYAGDKPLLGIVISANLADLVTTEMARASGNGREANPLLQNQKIFWGIKAGATTVESLVIHQLWTTDHKKNAVVLALLIGGFHGWVAQHNLGIARLR